MQGWIFFSLFLFFSLGNSSSRRSSLACIWKFKAPPRIVVFGWIALRGRILTSDNFWLRGKIAVNACRMCLAGEETVDQLLLISKLAQFLWRSVLNWFGCIWVLPHTAIPSSIFLKPGVCLQEVQEEKSYRGLLYLWLFGDYGRKGMQGVWMGLSFCADSLADSLKFTVASWMLVIPYFNGYSLDQIMHNW